MLVENIEAREVSQTQQEMHCVLLNVEAYKIKKSMSERGSTKDDGEEERAEGDVHA